LDSPTFFIYKSPMNCYRWNIYAICNTPSFVSTVQWLVSNTKGTFNSSNYSTYNLQSLYNYVFPDTGSYVIKMIVNGGTSYQRIIVDSVYQRYYPISFSTAPADTAVCLHQPTSYKARLINGLKPYSYFWKHANDSIALSTGDTLKLANDSLGNNPYFLIVSDSNNCSITRTFYANVLDIPISLLPASVRICFGDTFTLNPGNNTNGGIQTFLWNTGDTTQTITRRDSNLYILTILNKNGCSLKDSMMLFVNAKVNAKAYSDTTFCGSQTITLHATGGDKYEWRNTTNNLLIASKDTPTYVSFKFDTTSIAQVTVYKTQSGLECLAKDSVKLKVLIKPARPQIMGTDTLIHGAVSAFAVQYTAGNSFVWSVSNGFIQNGQGTYQLILFLNQVGKCVVSVVQRSIDGCYSDTGVYNVFVKPAAGIDEATSINSLRIFPNPSSGIFTVELNAEARNVEFEVTDILGRTIYRSQLESGSGIFKSNIDLNPQGKGIYFLKVSAGNSFKVSKITVE
ncbi:MAG: T9SS type A sorting domain-containing protein, partial [Bacteroidia bacterium]